MDSEVPEYLGAGISRDGGSLRALDDYNFTHELLELLHQGDAGAGSSFVDEKPSLNIPEKEVASEAEMASWLCEVFQQKPSEPPTAPMTTTTTTTNCKSEGESTMRGSSGGGAASGNRRAASDGTPADERPRSSGRRRSCSGKAAEQRRRDKINDKMKTLQQLMPRCSKTDKASTLEEVIQYVKSLQHQLQVLSSSGYAMPTAATILPPGVVPPSYMQQPPRDALGGQALAPTQMMLPPYPFIPAIFACPHHGHGTPPPAPPPPPENHYPVGSGSATQHLAQRRHSDDLAVPSHSRRSQK